MAINKPPESVHSIDAGDVSSEEDSMMDSSDRIENLRQSKLTQQELSDLQKATHFDKKELQQWYKGMLPRLPALHGSSC